MYQVLENRLRHFILRKSGTETVLHKIAVLINEISASPLVLLALM